jgi:hypothetical protein
MSKLDAVKRTAPATLAVPAFAMGAAIGQAGEEGFADYEFYVLGRGGAMGEVKADVVVSALNFFEPEWVRSYYNAALAKSSMAAAALKWNARVDSWGETGFSTDLPLERMCDLLKKVFDAEPLVGAPIFSGWRTMPEPESIKSLAMHRLYGLRELRGGLHGAAVRAAGLSPLQALLVRTPQLAAGWGWPEPFPDVTASFSAWQEAEDGTDRALACAFDLALTDAEADQLASDVEAVVEHTGMMWWFRDDIPTIQFGAKPADSPAAGS